MNEAARDEKRYVLVVEIDTRRPTAYGPFTSADDAEYAAMDYYGTAITGASIRGALLIAELHDGGQASDREHA